MALDFLTQGGLPATNTNQASQTTLPDWYNSYIQGIAGKAASIAQNPYQQYPGQRLADFMPAQQQAFQSVQNNQGNYQPQLQAAGQTLNNAVPQVQGALGQVSGYAHGATQAAAGPAQAWTDPGAAAKYMSPYTQNVVDEIGRLGNQNLEQNIIPQVQSNFVGSGQFGSSRNAQILGQNVRDAQLGITGQQSAALQSGYAGAAGMFGMDANRAQQQQQLQAQTQLGAGQTLNTNGYMGGIAAGQLASQQGALGQLQQSLGQNDANALNAVGSQQQGLRQTGYNTSYQDFLNQQNWDWSQLGKTQNAVSGVQLPAGASQSTSTASSPGTQSPMQWVGALQGLYNAYQGSPTTTTPPG